MAATPPFYRLLVALVLLVLLFSGAEPAWGKRPPVDSLKARLSLPRLPDTARVRCLWLLARLLKNEDMDSARAYAERSSRLARQIHDPAGEAHAQRWLGNILYQGGQYPAAQREFEACQRAARRAGLCALEAWAKMGIGLVAEGTGNVPGALAYFREAEAINAACPARDPWFEPVLLSSVGIAHLHANQPRQAGRVLRKALVLAQQAPTKKPGELLNIMDLVGIAQQQQHHLDSAIVIWQRELALARAEKLTRFETYALGNLANALLEEGRPGAAMDYARQALGLARRVGNQSQIVDFTLVHAKILHALRRPEAFDTLLRFNALNDTMMGQVRARVVAQAQARYDVAEKQARIRELEQQRRIVSLETDRQHARGRLLMLALFGAALLLAGGTFFYLRLERSRAALAVSEGEARAANATKDQLMSIIAHDLRGPVATVRQLLPMVLPAPEGTGGMAIDEATRGQASTLLTSGVYQLESLLDNLLQWGRAQSGQLVSQPQPLPVELVLAQATGPYEAGAAVKGVELRLKAPTGLRVYADLDLLRTVLRNLVSNAVKFTPAGGQVWIEAWVEPDAGKGLGERVRFGVRDTGRGLVAAHAARLLADEATDAPRSTPGTAGEAGTGLGLPLSARLVRLLGGELRLAESTVEAKGAHFTFALPVAG